MESALNWEQNSLINELTRGMELAKQLRVHLNPTSSAETRELLLQSVLSSYEKSLTILRWGGSPGQPQTRAVPAPPNAGMPESSVSEDGSPRSVECDKGFKDNHQDQNDVSKKRRILPTCTDHVRVCSNSGLEGPIDDGYSWRKYGQKDILGAKYPRSYYRCTYRNIQDCSATKQVQRSDDDPTIFEIIYRGKHTCNQNQHVAPPAPASPEKQELKQNNRHNNHHHHHQQQKQQQQLPSNMLFNFRTSSTGNNNEDMDLKEMTSHFTFPSTSFGWMGGENQTFSSSTLVNDSIFGSFSPAVTAPVMEEANYFSVPPCQRNSFGAVHNWQPSDLDLPEIISANTSATNSPIVDLDFSIDHVAIDPNFPFDTPGFFN